MKTDIYLKEEQVQKVNVTDDYSKIFVFLFNLDKKLFIMNRQILQSTTLDKNKNVFTSIQLVFFEKLKFIFDIDKSSIKTFSCSEGQNLYCYCLVKNMEYCFPQYWVDLDKKLFDKVDSKNFEIMKINYANLENYIKTHQQVIKKSNQIKTKFQNELIFLQKNKDEKIFIYNESPNYYSDKNVNKVALLLFNKKKELLFIKYKSNWILPLTTNPTGVIFLSLSNFFEHFYAKKINIEPTFTKMLFLRRYNLMIVFAISMFKKLFSNVRRNIQQNFQHQFVPYEKIDEFCKDENSIRILHMVKKEMEDFTKSNIFQWRYTNNET